MQYALDVYFTSPTLDVLSTLFSTLNAISSSSAFPFTNTITASLISRGLSSSSSAPSLNRKMNDYIPALWNYPLSITFYTHKIFFSLPLYRSLDEIEGTNITLLVRMFGASGTMKIFNAMLLRQRVLFCGYNHSAYEVCQMVTRISFLLSYLLFPYFLLLLPSFYSLIFPL